MGTITRFFKKAIKKLSYLISADGRELHRIKNLSRYKAGTTKIFGHNFSFVDSASFVAQYDEIFNRKTYNYKSKNTQPYIIDCGANVGVSVLFFKKKFPGAIIVAFEPDKNIFPILKSNIDKLDVKDVTLINKALWDKEGKMVFNADGADGGSIVEVGGNTRKESTIAEIETTSLRNYLNREVDFLKIDIEGAEAIVLEDCKDLLINVQKIFIEYHSMLNEDQHLDKILSTLSKCGFRYFVESITLSNHEPFVKRQTINNYDNLLSIYGYRE